VTSPYYAKFQCNVTNNQWIDPEKCIALMRGLINKFKDALTLSDNVTQQFQKFVAFLQQLNN
jgi:hypothetical protein